METNYKNEREGVSDSLYAEIHYWLKRKYGVATKCEDKNCTGKSKNFNWAKKRDKKYEFRRNNFLQLCRSCHSKYDFTERTIELMRQKNKNTNKTHCCKGHKFTTENTFALNGKYRICRKCKKIQQKKYKRGQTCKMNLIKTRDNIRFWNRNYNRRAFNIKPENYRVKDDLLSIITKQSVEESKENK